MGKFKWYLLFLGLLLIVIPFVFPAIVPGGSLVGISMLDNSVLSVILGLLFVILFFIIKKKERKFLINGQMLTPQQEAAMIKGGYAMEMKRI